MAGLAGCDPRIAVHAACHEVRKTRPRAGFPACPFGPQTTCPVRPCRLQPQAVDRNRVQSGPRQHVRQIIGRRRQSGRRRQRGRGRAKRGHIAPVWREHLHRPAGAGGDRPRLIQQMAVEAGHLEAIRLQLCLDAGVDFRLGFRIAPVPEHAAGLCRVGEGGDQHSRIAFENQQVVASSLQVGLQRAQRTGQPPARRAAERALACCCGGMDVDAKQPPRAVRSG
jgi:hypothetical protein